MSKLTLEEEALLEALRRAKRARDTLPPERARPIGRPDKYGNPLGMDHDGEWFLAPEAGDEKA
jgi:hypothetical protein